MDLKRENKKQAAIITEQAAIIATLRKDIAAKAHTAATLEAHETTNTATPALTPTAPVSVRSRAEAELNWMKHVMEPLPMKSPSGQARNGSKGPVGSAGRSGTANTPRERARAMEYCKGYTGDSFN